MAFGTVRTAVAAAAEMLAAFVDTGVVIVAMAAVMDNMNGFMRPSNAAAESLTSGFASASESSVPGLIAAGSAAASFDHSSSLCLFGALERWWI